MKRTSNIAGLIAGLSLLAPLPAFAQADWPNRPVKLIVPFGAGGSSDVLARIVAEQLGKTFKQQFVVENRPGAGGTIGVTNLSTLALAPFINQTVSYYPMKGLTHIAYVGGAPVLLSAAINTGVKTVAEFVAYTKAKSFTFVSSGVGSDGHLMGQAIALAMGLKVEHVPYSQTAQALGDLVAGHVPFSTFTLSSTSQFLRASQVYGVAVTTPERLPDYASVPTFSESGYPGLIGTTWFSISGPPKLPKEISERLNKEILAAVMRPETVERYRRDGFIANTLSAEDFTKFVADEIVRWKPVIEAAGLAKR